MRSPEGMGAAIWRKLGVGVSTLPGTEVYTALERGKVEATDWGTLGMNDELGYDDIAPYAIYPGVHSMPASDVALNLDVWNGLPDDLKQVLQEATVAFNQDSIQANRELDESFAAKRDPATLVNWGAEERRELREVAQEVWAEWAEKSEMAQRIYDSHVAYMKEHRAAVAGTPPSIAQSMGHDRGSARPARRSNSCRLRYDRRPPESMMPAVKPLPANCIRSAAVAALGARLFGQNGRRRTPAKAGDAPGPRAHV